MKKLFFVILIIIFLVLILKPFNYNKNNILRFSSWGSESEVSVLRDVIKKFEHDNPDIKVEFIHIPQNYFQKIHLLFASGLEPDVIFINNQYIQMYIDAGLLEDLSQYFNIDDFLPESIKIFSQDNKLYAIPRDISNLVLYCNKDIFKQKKIKLPDNLKNINELKELALKLTDNKHWGINYEPEPLFWLYYLASNSTGAISDDKNSIIINKEKSINTLNLYRDFLYKYKIAPTKSQIGSKTTAQMFINGELAMYLGGRWMVPKFRQSIDFDWDIIQFPVMGNAKLYFDASGWAIAKNSKNKTNAVKFIKYLSSKSTIDEFTKSGLIIPARADSFYDSIFLDSSKKPYNTNVYIKMLKITKPTPVNKNYPIINDILKEKSQNIFDSNQDAKDVFDDKTIKKLESLL